MLQAFKSTYKISLISLEELIILTLGDFNIDGVRIKNQPGVWVKDKNKFDKIAALGIRISSWVTYHGISINLDPNLEEFKNIVPCGIQNSGVSSINKLNKNLETELEKNSTNSV